MTEGISLPVNRPAVDSDPRTTSAASTECQHPGRIRCELHECRVRAIASVGTEQAGPSVMGAQLATNSRTDGSRAVHHRESVMGTVVTIDVYTTDGTCGSDVALGLARARAGLHRADAVFSTWKPHSPMSRLRRGEITSADVPSDVTEVLERCALARRHGRLVRSVGNARRSRPDGVCEGVGGTVRSGRDRLE